MIPVVCFSALLFGNWPFCWDEKNGRFKISPCYVLMSFCVICNLSYHIYASLQSMMKDDTVSINPQHLIVYTVHANIIILITNRFFNATVYGGQFADELMKACGRTVESGRRLLEYWLRMVFSVAIVGMLHYKYRRFSQLPAATVFTQIIVPVGYLMLVDTTAECLYTSACRVLADEFTALNRSATAVTAATAADEDDAAAAVVTLSETHSRLTRLVRLFNDEYAVPVLVTTVNLLLRQIYTLNDFVSAVVDSEKYEPSYVNYTCFNDTFVWTVIWFRFWWICYRVDGLVTQVHLTAKIMLAKDINSFPEKTRKLVIKYLFDSFDFLDQLLHRRIRISAWGFYDVNNELLFMVLGCQFGLCLICTQFNTSGIQIINSITTVEKNRTSMTSE